MSHRFEVIRRLFVFKFGTKKNSYFAFLSPFEGLRATYAVHIKLTYVDFLLVIIKLFFTKCTALRAKID